MWQSSGHGKSRSSEKSSDSPGDIDMVIKQARLVPDILVSISSMPFHSLFSGLLENILFLLRRAT